MYTESTHIFIFSRKQFKDGEEKKNLILFELTALPMLRKKSIQNHQAWKLDYTL